MGKNLYSLILSEEVVDAIDELAYAKGMNRSQLINAILAEKVNYTTPEQQVSKIIDEIAKRLENHEGLQLTTRNENGSIQMGTYLRYKYKPRIKYSFEFFTRQEKRYALLKVNTRTKSPELTDHLSRFFNLLALVDSRRFKEIHSRQVNTYITSDSNNRFTREFLSGISLERIGEEHVAQYMSNYIQMLDASLKYYFSHLEDDDHLYEVIDGIYCHYLRELDLFKI